VLWNSGVTRTSCCAIRIAFSLSPLINSFAMVDRMIPLFVVPNLPAVNMREISSRVASRDIWCSTLYVSNPSPISVTPSLSGQPINASPKPPLQLVSPNLTVVKRPSSRDVTLSPVISPLSGATSPADSSTPAGA